MALILLRFVHCRARLVVVETAAPWADVLDFGPDAAAFEGQFLADAQ